MLNAMTVSGWAQPHDSLVMLAPGGLHLSYESCREITCVGKQIAHKKPQVDTAIGWSLGGTLLMHAIAEGHLHVKQLVLIGASLQFVASDDYPLGMDRFTFDTFLKNYEADPVRTARRFSALVAKGDAYHDCIVRELGFWEESANKERWLPWLQVLDRYSYHSLDPSGFPPTLIIHGKNDHVSKVQQAEALARFIPGSTLQVIEACGHAPHLHDHAQVKMAIDEHWHTLASRAA
ncbi:MAG: alpha/beta fold hydrolase [Rickettsiales bacterium]